MKHDDKLIGACLALLLFAFAAPAAAQWIDYPTPGIPRTADGKPNLSAPAPKTHDGKPDLSGMWAIGGLGFMTNITNTPMLTAAEKLYKARLETYGNDDPIARCLPEGPRTALAGLDPMRIIQSPYLIVMIYEVGGFRQIFLDGRPLPKDQTPTWMGYSTGRWEGDTLVVETAGFNDKTWLDFSGHPHSEALHVTERYRRIDFGRMRLDITFDDPKTYTKPFSIGMDVAFQADADILENICLENEKSHARMIGKVSDEKKGEKKVPAAVLAQYAGVYDLGPLGAWTVSAANDQLFIELADGGGQQEVFPQSESSFIFPTVGGTVSFGRDGKGAVTHFTLTIVEGDFKAMRK